MPRTQRATRLAPLLPPEAAWRDCSRVAGWAAPEVLLGHGYSHKCDLWSFGVVCWETMTARVPFDGMSQVLVATRVALEGMRLPVPADAPMPLLRLMARCWAEVPALRPDFSEVLAELQALAKVGEVGHAVN